MKAIDLVELAARNLRESVLRNSLTTVGIGVGVASLVSMLSLGIGLQELASSRLNQSGLFDSITVMPRGRGFGGPGGGPGAQAPPVNDTEEAAVLDETARQAIERLAEVREVYPDVRFTAELRFGEKSSRGSISGVPFSARETEAFQQKQGKFFSSGKAAEALLQRSFAAELLGKGRRGRGKQVETPAAELAKDLLGKAVVIRYAERVAGAAAASFSVTWREQPVTVVGIVEREAPNAPGRFPAGVFLPLQYAQEMHVMDAADFRDSGRALSAVPVYSSLTVKLKNAAQAASLQTKVKGMGFNTFSIVDVSSGLRQVFLVIDSFLGAFGSLALAVASIGIVNTLIMAILERRREIGIMKSLGASDLDVKMIFFAEAGTLGFIGGILGVTLGWAIGRVINFGFGIYLDRQGLPPVQIWYVPWWLVIGGIAFAVGTSLVAGWFPARKAARLDPVEALRYE